MPVSYKLVYKLSLGNYLEPAKYTGFVSGVISLVALPLLLISQKHSMIIQNIYIGSKFEMIFLWSLITLHSFATLKLVYSVPQRIYFR